MFALFCIFLFPLSIVSTESEFTFQNVEFKGYSMYTLKFTKIIEKSNSLKEHVPKGPYDHLEFLDQNIPVLMENSIKDLDNLDELTIENCNLNEIKPGALKNLPFLRKLSLRRNDLEEIKAGVFNNLSVSTLDLSKNRIKRIDPNALDNMPNILNINLAKNLIKEWNKRWFFNVPALTRISMQNNSLEKIPADAFQNLNEIDRKLSISLLFSFNKIHTIEANAFRGVKQVHSLWLDNNKLTSFDDKLLEGLEIENLRLGSNHISCLTGDMSKIFKAETTYMDDNPFDCDCLNKIKEWSKGHNKQVVVHYSELECLVQNITGRVDQLNKRLKEVKGHREREETTRGPGSSDEVEILFK